MTTLDLIHKDFAAKEFTVNEGERSVVGMISSTAVDREGDVVLPSGMDTSEFKANPVVMFIHGGLGSSEIQSKLPVARGSVKRMAEGVMGKATFAKRPEAHPTSAEWLPDILLSLYQQDILRAFSIGLGIVDARRASDADRKRFGDGATRIVEKWKLFEFSIVPIPMNQEALATGVSKGMRANMVTRLWNVQAPKGGGLDLGMREVLVCDTVPLELGGPFEIDTRN